MPDTIVRYWDGIDPVVMNREDFLLARILIGEPTVDSMKDTIQAFVKTGYTNNDAIKLVILASRERDNSQ